VVRALGQMAAGLARERVTAAIAAALFATASMRSVPLHAAIGNALAQAAAPTDILANAVLTPLIKIHGTTRVPAERQALALWTVGIVTYATRHALAAVAVRWCRRRHVHVACANVWSWWLVCMYIYMCVGGWGNAGTWGCLARHAAAAAQRP
jgi:hypothetical protein